MPHKNTRKPDLDWESESGESDDSSDSDDSSSVDSEGIEELLRNASLLNGDVSDFAVKGELLRGGPSRGRVNALAGVGSSAGHHGHGHGAPPHLKGKALGEYYRLKSKLEKQAKKIPGEKEKRKDRKERKRQEKAAKKKDPKELPVIYLSPRDQSQLEKLLESYKKSQRPAPHSSSPRKPARTPHMPVVDPITALETEEAEILDLGDHETEEWQEIVDADNEMPVSAMPSRTAAERFKLESLSMKYMDELARKQSEPGYQEMLRFRKKLPAYQARHDLLRTISNNQVTVVSGETGCGKTTQLPQFILDDWIERGEGACCTIVCTQPRRISAISVSERIARERAENLGVSVGYQIRLEKKVPRKECSILMCTTGVLLQWLNSNSQLNGVSHVIVDEIHEQDVLSDFLLIILKDLRIARPDLRIILMSATINADKFSQYFGGCPLMNIPGFTFPVQELFLEDILALTNYRPKFPSGKMKKMQGEEDREWDQFLQTVKPKSVQDVLRVSDESVIDLDLVCALVRHISQKHPQNEAILIFLPGWEDIKKLTGLLGSALPSANTLIIPLHSMMPTINQRQVFDRPVGKRKIVVATSIAETSITIDDIVHVIDCGQIKMKDFDVARNLSTLKAQWVSVSNARQRRGRAGRVKSGICYHVYTSFQFKRLAMYPLPEMQRTRLDELSLQIKLLKLGKVATFVEKAMEPPSPHAVVQAIELLNLIGALDDKEKLTPLGHLLARTPVPPQLGKMMYLGCIFKCIEPILDIAAVLGYRDPFCTPLGREEDARKSRNSFGAGTRSDHLLYHVAIKDYIDCVFGQNERPADYCWNNFMFPSTVQQILKMKKQFALILNASGFLPTSRPDDQSANVNSGNDDVIRAVVSAGLYPNFGTMKKASGKNQGTSIQTQNKEKTSVHPKSFFGRGCTEQGVVAYFSVVKTSKIYIHDITVLGNNLPAVLFCRSLSSHEKMRTNVLSVDGWLDFRCAGKETARILQGTRDALEEILHGIYRNTLRDGAPNSDAEAILRKVEHLFSFKTCAFNSNM